VRLFAPAHMSAGRRGTSACPASAGAGKPAPRWPGRAAGDEPLPYLGGRM